MDFGMPLLDNLLVAGAEDPSVPVDSITTDNPENQVITTDDDVVIQMDE